MAENKHISVIEDEKGEQYSIFAKQLEKEIKFILSGDVNGFVSTELDGDATINTALGDGVVTLDKIAQSAKAGEIQDNNETLATHEQVKNYVDTLVGNEATAREGKDTEIITSLTDETLARRVNDELLQQQIEEVAVQSDFNQDDTTALDFIKNRPTSISTAEIEGLFI